MNQDIPKDLLEELKCSKCYQYLSKSPVYLQLDGTSVCSNCFSPCRPAIRNTLYETLASFSRFPCMYQELGCKVTVPFSGEKEVVQHEQVCDFHPYVCPLMGSTKCDWMGNRKTMLEHCRSKHPGRVLSNPANMSLDITKNSENDYIIFASDFMFLLQIKVCITTRKIYYAARCLEDLVDNHKFIFILDIKRGSCVISRSGVIQKLNDPPTKESSCVVVNINSLLDLFCGFDGTSFVVTIKQLDEIDDKNGENIIKKHSGASAKSLKDNVRYSPKSFPNKTSKIESGNQKSSIENRRINSRTTNQGKVRNNSAKATKTWRNKNFDNESLKLK